VLTNSASLTRTTMAPRVQWVCYRGSETSTTIAPRAAMGGKVDACLFSARQCTSVRPTFHCLSTISGDRKVHAIVSTSGLVVVVPLSRARRIDGSTTRIRLSPGITPLASKSQEIVCSSTAFLHPVPMLY